MLQTLIIDILRLKLASILNDRLLCIPQFVNCCFFDFVKAMSWDI